MPKWIPCGESFVTGDVVRWKEPVWKPKARKSSKPKMIGERLITAQVVQCDAEWVEFALQSCQTTNAELWWKRIPELKANEPLRRRRGPLLKKSPERRPWDGKDGEAARSALALRDRSRFL